MFIAADFRAFEGVSFVCYISSLYFSYSMMINIHPKYNFFLLMSHCRINVSYNCVTHVVESGFNVYCSKGHPSKEKLESMKLPNAMESKINK